MTRNLPPCGPGTASGRSPRMSMAAGWPSGVAGALVAGWPALAFILALESLAGLLRGGRDSKEIPVNLYYPEPAEADDEPPEPPSTDEALRLLLATGSRRVLAEALSVPKSRVDSWAARSAEAAGLAETVPLNGRAPDG